MNKPTIIYILLLLVFFTSSLGEECSDYNDAKPYVCGSLKLDATDKKCVYVNNECKELPNQCSDYKGSVAAECQSINPTAYTDNIFKACIFESNSCRLKEFNYCFDYKAGLPKEFCENIYQPNGARCKLVNNECKSYYYSCYVYPGEYKSICE